MAPLAYLVTFACYGQRLHGDPRGSVDRFHNVIGGRYVSENPGRVAYLKSRMIQESYGLDAARRPIVLEAIVDCCQHREWGLLAAHVREDHVHAVIATDNPKSVIIRVKANASWLLRERLSEPKGIRRWAEGGSCRRLKDRRATSAAIDYVVHKQGPPMEVYEDRTVR